MARRADIEPKFPEDTVISLRISLREIEPLIWRRVEVPATITLPKLHMVFQDSFGWTNSHLHSFYIGDKEYGHEDELGELDIIDERSIKLCKLLKANTPGFWYLYDFGDHWQHDVQIEHILPVRADRTYPICTAGARKCPPEDCGGVGGYERLLEVIRNPKNDEYKSMLEWLGGKYDPDDFDLLAVNRNLKKYAKAEPAGKKSR